MNTTVRTLVFQACAVVAASLSMSVVAFAVKAEAPASAQVRIDNFSFNQQVVTVHRGTSVTWTNGDDIPHNVVAKNGAFRSKVLDTGNSFTFTFAKVGEFEYFCALHPHMTGKIVVKA